LDIDLQEIFRVLNEIMPYLAKQKMQLDQQKKLMQIYLEKQLAGYGALEEKEKRGRAEKYDYDTMLKLLGSVIEGSKGLDRPGMAGRMRAGELGIPLPVPEIAPEQYGEAVRPYTETMVDQAGALEAGKYLPAEKMGLATQLLGSKRAMELLEEIGKTRAGREAREVTREKTRLGWAELGVKGEKLTKKQLEEKLKFFGKKEKVFEGQLESLEDLSGLMEGDPEYDTKKTQIAEMRQNQLNTLDQLLGELDKKKADRIIAKLRASKITARGMEKHKDQFMKEENLTEAEYNYIRLNL